MIQNTTSSIWIDRKYVDLAATRLHRFKLKKTNPYLAICRCPYCGDSEKSKTKTRGYVYEKDSKVFFFCHNCTHSTNLKGLLTHIDVSLSQEYSLECLKEFGTDKPQPEPYKADIGKFTKPRFSRHNELKSLKKISQLALNHPARVYVADRKIPTRFHHKLYFCPKFATWVNTIVPGKFDDWQLKNDEPRLIIPFIDQEGYLFGFQGRSFKKNTDLRYITIMLDEDKPKVFGLDDVDFSKDVYIVEGPIDSMFLKNSLAMAGSDVPISSIVSKERAVVLYDNQPRNTQIVKKIFQTIQLGYRVVLLPSTGDGKDINDLALAGMTEAEILEYVNRHSSSGLSAMIRFNEWKKVDL